MLIHLSRIIGGELVRAKFCTRARESKVFGSKTLESMKVTQKRKSRMFV